MVNMKGVGAMSARIFVAITLCAAMLFTAARGFPAVVNDRDTFNAAGAIVIVLGLAATLILRGYTYPLNRVLTIAIWIGGSAMGLLYIPKALFGSDVGLHGKDAQQLSVGTVAVMLTLLFVGLRAGGGILFGRPASQQAQPNLTATPGHEMSRKSSLGCTVLLFGAAALAIAAMVGAVGGQ